MTKDTVLDRIRKLLAHAHSAQQVGSQQEAEAFAAKANQLMLEHQLGLTDVELAAQEKEQPVGRGAWVDLAEALGVSARRRVTWLEVLGNALCEAHFCQLLIVPHRKWFQIVGRAEDRAIVEYLFITLARMADDLADRYGRRERRRARELGVPSPKNQRLAFLLGFASAIRDRLRANRREIENQRGRFAIVRFRDAEKAVQRWIEEEKARGNIGRSTDGPNDHRKRFDVQGWHAGRQAGDAASIHGGLGSGGGRDTLSRGQGALGKGNE